ncbi:DUF4148 domain-containing protein [Achromobacter pestifer]|uniref:DUF4148 domain-containing protein n=1 Tax=Achromobacter pestifer TaxID=1353889 RepID=A0A6S6YX11_9BURK|nr:hypothetical protein [Achromobacter pestifer]CAB3638364.1 hypothetical protein LMG3431_01874 [Achromobacter pestifer]
MTIKFATVAAMLALVLGTGNAFAAEETDVPPPKPSTMTQADVKADLRAWRESGLADLSRTQDTLDTNSTEYRQRYAEYLRLLGRAPQGSVPTAEQRG